MNIIEQFYILFKSDASEVKKGADEAKKATTNLDESLKNVNKSTEKVGQSFIQLVKAAAGFLGIAVAAHKVLAGITEANNYALQLGDASRALGVNAAELDIWGNAVKRTGGTVEGFQSSLRALSQHFGSSAEVALKVLPKLADVFQRLGRFRSLQYGKMLGLDEATILLLQSGRREVENVIRRQKELGSVTEVNIEDARKYRNAQNDLETAFRSLYLTLGHEVIPILTKFYNFLVPVIEYIKRHKDLVIGAFIAIGAAAAVMLAPFIILNAEIIAIAAGIALLIAAFAIDYEDIQAFRHGHNSLIGDILKKWPLVGTVVKAAFEGLKQILEIAFAPLFAAVKAGEYLASLFGSSKKIDFNIGGAQQLLDTAATSPIASMNSTSILSAYHGYQRNSSINIDNIAIHTQATDAVGISRQLDKTMQSQFYQTANNFADGVSK